MIYLIFETFLAVEIQFHGFPVEAGTLSVAIQWTIDAGRKIRDQFLDLHYSIIGSGRATPEQMETRETTGC